MISTIELKKGDFQSFLSVNPLAKDAPQQWEFLSLGDPKYVNRETRRWNKILNEKHEKKEITKDELEERRKHIWNIPDFQNAFYKKLAVNYRLISWMLSLTHNLRREDLYDVFNAKTLDDFFKNLLINCEQDKRHPIDFDYRLSVCEIGHVMLKWAMKYLKSSPQFRGNKNTLENIERILNDFESLSISLFIKDNLSILREDLKEINRVMFH